MKVKARAAKKRARVGTVLVPLLLIVAFSGATRAEASLERTPTAELAPAITSPATSPAIIEPEPQPRPALFAAPLSPHPEAGEGRFFLFGGDELARAVDDQDRSESFHPLAAVGLLADERAPPDLASRFPKTRIGGFDFLGTRVIGVYRGASLELRWGCEDFSCGISEDIFLGLWTDPVTGLAYARDRWFDSRTASWLSQDLADEKDSPNRYAFAKQRPHEYTDPLGLEASVSKNGTIVIADRNTGKITRYSPDYIRANGDVVRRILGTSGGVDPRKADAMMVQARAGSWVGNEKVTALAKGVSTGIDQIQEGLENTVANAATLGVYGKLYEQAERGQDLSVWKATQDAAYDITPFEEARQLIQEGDQMDAGQKIRAGGFAVAKTAGMALIAFGFTGAVEQTGFSLGLRTGIRPATLQPVGGGGWVLRDAQGATGGEIAASTGGVTGGTRVGQARIRQDLMDEATVLQCWRCGQQTTNPANLHLGHRNVPTSKGGNLSPANVCLEGAACNLGAGNRGAVLPGRSCAERGGCGAPFGRTD